MTTLKYNLIKDFADKHNLNYSVINQDTEISPAMDYGLEFLDTDIFEMPASFMVKNALLVYLPKYDNNSDKYDIYYAEYYKLMSDLRELKRPQYIAIEGHLIRIMIWCNWD